MTPSPSGRKEQAVPGSILVSSAGFGLSLLLTGASFLAASRFDGSAATVIALLAFAQLLVQLMFFLHLGKRPGGSSDVSFGAFTLIVIGILIGGTLWIMDNLSHLHGAPATTEALYEDGVVSPQHELK